MLKIVFMGSDAIALPALDWLAPSTDSTGSPQAGSGLGGELQFLPALPPAWRTGSVKGLRARGGFEITHLSWKDGKLERAEIRSTLGGDCRLRHGEQVVTRHTQPGEVLTFQP